jgi:hypothetical protein
MPISAIIVEARRRGDGSTVKTAMKKTCSFLSRLLLESKHLDTFSIVSQIY